MDALDRVCARHDAFTPDRGLADAACHAALERDARAVERDDLAPGDLRAMAGLVAMAATVMPSAPVPLRARRVADLAPDGPSPAATRYRPVP